METWEDRYWIEAVLRSKDPMKHFMSVQDDISKRVDLPDEPGIESLTPEEQDYFRAV